MTALSFSFIYLCHKKSSQTHSFSNKPRKNCALRGSIIRAGNRASRDFISKNREQRKGGFYLDSITISLLAEKGSLALPISIKRMQNFPPDGNHACNKVSSIIIRQFRRTKRRAAPVEHAR